MVKSNDIIVLKKAEDELPPKKGGVWKIAHADFMTAMMAFFLIMWLVNATDEEIKKSIANYFNPMNLMAAPTAVRGMSDPSQDTLPPASGEEDGKKTGETPLGSESPGEEGSALGGGNVEEGNERTMASAGMLEETDNADFNDPFAELASSASDIEPDQPTAVDVPESTLGTEGTEARSENVRDPFDPAYWQTVQAQPSQSLRPGRSDSADTPPQDAEIDAGAPQPRGANPQGSDGPHRAADPEQSAAAGMPDEVGPQERETTPQVAIGPRSAVADAILSSVAAPDAAGDADLAQPRDPSRPLPDSQEKRAAAASEELQQALAGASGDAEVQVTAGEKTVLISLTDGNAVSMFAIGSSNPTGEALDIFNRVGAVLAERNGQIIVRGHTDARPFRSRTSDNWTLSFERAHATKNALVASGVDEARFVRVEGLADRDPANPDDPLADQNRRIEILYRPAPEAQ